MLTFRSRSMVTCELLKLTKPLLEDLRAEVVIATLRLLQRRHDPEILKAINGCISSEALPGVAESAIQALGCIGTQQSCQLLIAQAQQLQNFSLLSAVERQLQAQVRHRNWIDQTLRDNHQTL
jgi:HEAT repeat protein